MPDESKKTPEESIADAKYAIAGTRATIPHMVKTMENIRDQADDVVQMLNEWASQDLKKETTSHE